MKLSPTEALKRISVSADTLYKDMKSGKVSFEKKANRKRLIDVSELERVYGPLRPEPAQQISANASPDIRTDARTAARESLGLGAEIAALKQQLESLAQERRRERELLQEQIQHLQDTLKNAQDHQTRLTALLTDQRSETARKEAQEQAQLIRELKMGQTRLRHELRALQQDKRGFLARWLGIGQGPKHPPAKTATAQHTATPSRERVS